MMRENGKLDSNAINDLNTAVQEVDADATGRIDPLTGNWAIPVETLPVGWEGWELDVEWAE